MIAENEWPFEFYFDYNKTLFNKLTKLNIVPQTFIYNGNLELKGAFKGVKPNVGYCLKGGKIEKIRTNFEGKYAHLDCDLIQYEEVILNIVKKSD